MPPTDQPSQSAADEADLTGPTVLGPPPVSQLGTLLAQLEESAGGALLSPAHVAKQDQLAQSRLGVAAGLLTALRCKHAATAAHSLRVALGCSKWGLAAGLAAEQLDDVEIAALLHDVGKIGVPDRVLLKPGSLSSDEVALVERHREMGLDILLSCAASEATRAIVKYAPAWYDGSKDGFDRQGDDLPLGARMVTIVDAFDAMTTDHVYRPAMSRERALTELFEFAGTQFDAALVAQFAELHEGDDDRWQEAVARRWLNELAGGQDAPQWRLGHVASNAGTLILDHLFQRKFFENVHDAVVFVDANLQVAFWNRGAERLTGISASSVYQKSWTPTLIGMRNEHGEPLDDDDCPVKYSIQSGVQALRRLIVAGRHDREVSVDFHSVPVTGADGTTHGATVLLHDASSEISLEQRCQNLHEQATKDALTQVANRAEFERVHPLFVEAHLERKLPCSMFICDLDRFKSINDTYGHPAGDEVIRSFTRLLKSHCRPGDLVARYGGEEFVVLCADCTNAVAARRADQVRREFNDMPQEVLGGAKVTACFGVTEVQPGDTPETMLHRADRALLSAKDAGRNRVVQLGTGVDVDVFKERRTWWWTRRTNPDVILQQDLVTAVPLQIAIEKLRGFVADHSAEILSIDENRVRLRIDDERNGASRRGSDRPFAFLVDLVLEEDRAGDGKQPAGRQVARSICRTKINITIRPLRSRDRRRTDATQRAKQVLVSFRSYLMATAYRGSSHDTDRGVLRKATGWITPWRTK